MPILVAFFAITSVCGKDTEHRISDRIPRSGLSKAVKPAKFDCFMSFCTKDMEEMGNLGEGTPPENAPGAEAYGDCDDAAVTIKKDSTVPCVLAKATGYSWTAKRCAKPCFTYTNGDWNLTDAGAGTSPKSQGVLSVPATKKTKKHHKQDPITIPIDV